MEKKLYESIQEVVVNEARGAERGSVVIKGKLRPGKKIGVSDKKGKAEYSAKFEKEWPAKNALMQTSETISKLWNATNYITRNTDADPAYLADLIKKHIPSDLPSGKKLHKLIPELKKFAKTAKELKKLANDVGGEFDPILKKAKVGRYAGRN